MSFNLSTNFGGLELGSPVIIGSCPMTAQEIQRIAMISNGAGAMVLPSFFEEQFVVKTEIADSPQSDIDSYLDLVESANKQVSIPVIASINGSYSTDWQNVAQRIGEAGASAIEYSIRRPHASNVVDPRQIEDEIVMSAEKIKKSIGIPLFIKLTRDFTSISSLAGRLKPHVDGLVLFGRAPVVDIELDSLKRSSQWSLSESGLIVRSLETMMQLRGTYPDLAIAACGGVGTSIDLIKSLLAGANAVMITSAIYRDGPVVIGSLLQGLTHFMETHNMRSLGDLSQAWKQATGSVGGELQNPSQIPSPHDQKRDCSNPNVVCDRFGHPRSVN